MTSADEAAELAEAQSSGQAQDDELRAARGLVRSATGRLLGATIAVDDAAWRAPSRLPGWSRGHVASHVARQAEGLGRLAAWAATGRRQDMYASPQQRTDDIEAGAARPGLELQVDLDATAGALEVAFDRIAAADAWDAVVELRGGQQVPARLLPLARLTEVVLHHVDLDIAYGLEELDATTAGWLLEWSAYRLRSRDEFPRVELVADTGRRLALGTAGAPRRVTGTPAALLGWLTGRAGPETVTGTDGLVLPSF